MNKFIENLKNVSEKIYDQIGGTEEKHIQAALSIEFDKLKIPHLREPSIQIYYDGNPLGFLELDFIVSPHDDLEEYLIIEMKQASKIDDSNRHQLKSQLRSAPYNNHEIIKKVREYNPEEIILLPLYPQYSASTSGSSINEWNSLCKKENYKVKTKMCTNYSLKSSSL